MKEKSQIAGLADALKKSMDEDKVVTPMNLATLTPTIGLNGQKSKESVSNLAMSASVSVSVSASMTAAMSRQCRGNVGRL